MRVKLTRSIVGNVLAEALMETASSFEESCEVIQTTEDRFEIGSGKKVLDTLSLSITWRERTLKRGLFDFLRRRKPHEKATGYGYGLHCSEIETDKTYYELDITEGAFVPSRSTFPIVTPDHTKRPQDHEASKKLLEEFLDALFGNLGLNDEAPQGA